MSVRAVAWAWKQDTTTAEAKFLLVTIAKFANADWYAWPANSTLAELTKIAPRTLRERIKELTALGLLHRAERYDKRGRRTSNLYRLNPTVTPEAKCEAGDGDMAPDAMGNTAVAAGTNRHEMPHLMNPSKGNTPPTPPSLAVRASGNEDTAKQSVHSRIPTRRHHCMDQTETAPSAPLPVARSWSPEWWCLLFDQIERGRSVGGTWHRARSNPNSCVTVHPEQYPSPAAIASMRQINCQQSERISVSHWLAEIGLEVPDSVPIWVPLAYDLKSHGASPPRPALE